MEGSRSDSADESASREAELRARVEEKYDFDDFSPEDMAQMTPEEWDAAFDPESWITGPELLERVERDLEHRIASRDVFAVVERQEAEGRQRLIAYSDEGYALVYEDGSIEGRGTVLRDVKSTVALASMPGYEVPEGPAESTLPDPEDVAGGSGDLANVLMQVIAGVQLLAGVVLLGWTTFFAPSGEEVGRIVGAVAGLLFLAFGVFLLFMVANARLSDRFRAEEYRSRLRGLQTGRGLDPDAVTDADDAREEDAEPDAEDRAGEIGS